MIFKEWLTEWFENYVKPSAKDKTQIRYSEIISQHLIPDLGEYEMEELTPLVLQRYVTELMNSGNLKTGEGLAPNSVNAIITIIQSALQQACAIGYLNAYTADKIKRPKTVEKKIECFSVAEQKKIEQAVWKDKRPKMFGVILCLYTGLRIGELLALEWSDIDFAKGEITVSKSCHDGTQNGRYCRLYDGPKTETSERIVPVPKQLLPRLREAKKASRSRWVIGNGEKIISIRSYQYSFSLLLKKLGIPHRGFHSLRHTFATRAMECGMDVKTLSEILGHKNPTVTLKRYAHSLLSHKHEMMNRLGKLL
ncbi:MAG: site-specific integrase [Eubacterium sp.]|nr:site-specific integrase [Eubacterium sp.]